MFLSLKMTVNITHNVLHFNGNFHFQSNFHCLYQFLQMTDVSFWNETITINTHSNTLEIITTREL